MVSCATLRPQRSPALSTSKAHRPLRHRRSSTSSTVPHTELNTATHVSSGSSISIALPPPSPKPIGPKSWHKRNPVASPVSYVSQHPSPKHASAHHSRQRLKHFPKTAVGLLLKPQPVSTRKTVASGMSKRGAGGWDCRIRTGNVSIMQYAGSSCQPAQT